MSRWRKYRRLGLAEMRPYREGESLEGISVSQPDREYLDVCQRNDVRPGGMIARNPENHDDQWYVSQAYFEANFEVAPEDG